MGNRTENWMGIEKEAKKECPSEKRLVGWKGLSSGNR